ncbi:MAG: cytochrome P450 [Actinomycetota bacterium]
MDSASQPSPALQPSEMLFNPFDPEFRIDPVPTYRRLLDEAPRLPLALGTGCVLSKHADCMAVLEHPGTSHDFRNSETFRALQGGDYMFTEEFERRRSFLFMDPPDHTRLRGLVSKAFSRRRLEALRPRVNELVDELIDRVFDAGEMELIEDFAYPLPVTVISEMLGVPPADHAVFGDWSRELARSLDPEPMIAPEVVERRNRAADAFREYFTKLIEQRRRDPKEDLLSALIAAEEAGEKLTLDELLSTLILLLIAGHETTVNLLGNGVLALLRNRDQFEALKQNPSLSKGMVEETLRYDPPVLFTGRVVMEDVHLDGLTLEKGWQTLLLLGAANRDPEVFDDPNRFDIDRKPNPHLAFGMGIHFCLGAPLARLEGEIGFASIARRLPDLELATESPDYRENIVLRGLAALPVSF